MSTDPPPPFQLISSLRYDPILPEVVSQQPALAYPDPLRTPYYLLPYHLDRLTNAARHFCWHHALHLLDRDVATFLALLDGFIPDRTRPWRLRIVIEDKSEGGLTVEVNPTVPVEEPRLLVLPFTTTATATATATANSAQGVWRVYVDSQPTIPSAFTTHKTTAREYYTAARHRAGIRSPHELAEVLVVNPAGEVMEGSITTPYFRRRSPDNGSSEWVTPPLSCGGNAGTTRRYALAQGFCSEQVIPAAGLVDGEECWISNGVRGFMRGVVVLNREDSI